MTTSQREQLRDEGDGLPTSIEIFGGDFAVQPLDDPKRYLSSHSQNRGNN